MAEYQTFAKQLLKGRNLSQAWNEVNYHHSPPVTPKSVLHNMMCEAMGEEIMRYLNNISLKTRAQAAAKGVKGISGVKYT
jgi:hypothetical protein